MGSEYQNQDENANFKSLVQGISQDERQILLGKIQKENQSAGASESFSSSQTSFNTSEHMQSLRVKLNQEPLLHKFILWLKALFTSSSVEEVYNKSLLTLIAREIDKNNPGLIDTPTHSFTSIFFDMLTPLKAAQSLFEPIINEYALKPNAFFITLGSLVMPYLHDQIKKEADPYIYPTDKELSKETRGNLIHKMNAIIDSIPADAKAEMYNAVKYMEWMKQFCNLDFSRLLMNFGNGEDGKSCPYIQLRSDFANVANVLSGHRSYTEALLIAAHQFSEQERVYELMGKNQPLRADFIEKASAELSLVTSFIDDVPMENLAKLVYHDSQYTVTPTGGGEDWFSRYKAQWKVLFDKRWESWNRDLKKNQIRQKIENYFNMRTIPVFKHRPWTQLWGGVQFRYELTLGFLAFFFTTQYEECKRVLKTVALEGDFSIKENRMEFTDIINSFDEIADNLEMLEEQLSSGGEYGHEFELCDSRGIASQTANVRAKELMSELEDRTQKMLNSFGKSCRVLESLMCGILSEKITAYYGPLLNLVKIAGRGNKKFLEELHSTRYTFEHAFEISKELEALDLPVS